MAGQVYLQKSSDPKGLKAQMIENVQSIGVASPFLVVTYTDGTTVLEKAEEFARVQFTPYATEDEESSEGESTDNATA